MGVNRAFRDLSPSIGSRSNSLNLKDHLSPFIYIYRSQRVNLTVDLTVKFFSVFCFGILPSSHYTERGKPYK